MVKIKIKDQRAYGKKRNYSLFVETNLNIDARVES